MWNLTAFGGSCATKLQEHCVKKWTCEKKEEPQIFVPVGDSFVVEPLSMAYKIPITWRLVANI